MVAQLPEDEIFLGYLPQEHLLSQGSHQALCVHLSQTQHVERTAVWTKQTEESRDDRTKCNRLCKGGRTSTVCIFSPNMTFKWRGAFSTLWEKLGH